MADPNSIRIAIVGGGCAGIAAAWHLSQFQKLRDDDGSGAKEPRLSITVFERSWRPGGKGASGRDAQGRIHEHGLHIWLGFYENAFRMMRDCYEKVPEIIREGHPLPLESFEEAFFPEPHIGVATVDRGGKWEAWSGLLPPMKGLPGDQDENSNPFTLAGYLARCIGLSKALIHSVVAPPSGVDKADERSTLDESVELNFSLDATKSPDVILESMTRLLRVGTLVSAAMLLQASMILEQWLKEHNPARQFSSTVLSFIEALATQVRRQLNDFVGIDEHVRRKTEVIDLIMTIVVGLYRDRVLFDKRGLDAINHIDCKDWLLKHGAMRESVASPFVTGLYDLAFCYREGDRSKPALAAGQALRGALRMFFTYRGSLFWHMRAGMGDTVFAPLYRVLRKRKVEFRFLHELDRIEFSDLKTPTPRVKALHFKIDGTEAEIEDYGSDPLRQAGCWRHEPPAFASGRYTTKLAPEAFDFVVFAVGIDDFRTICIRSKKDDPEKAGLFDLERWNNMQAHVKTVGTQAAQVWLDQSLDELGWKRGPALVSAMEHPFESWADMTHTLAAERAWRQAVHPQQADTHATRSIAYFVGLLSDADIETANKSKVALEKHVRRNLSELLSGRITTLWPDAKALPAHLVGEDGSVAGKGNQRQIEQRLKQQHLSVNFEGSERYTLALPGSLEYRISPLDRTVINMTIAGDWTECGFNEGCVEAAVMSGMLASHAICGFPALNDIVGYNHP